MKINYILLILILVIQIGIVSATEIDNCKTLDTDGESYILNQSVSSSGTCFTINADNITLDGNGYNINFSILKFGVGIINGGYDNVTIKNIHINQINFSLPYSNFNDSYHAYVTRGSVGELIDSKGLWFQSTSNNGLIFNVSINVSREAILFDRSHNNTILNSTAISNISAGIFVYDSLNVSIINSRAVSYTSDTNITRNYMFRAIGIQIDNSSNSLIFNSSGTSNIGYGIMIFSSVNTNLSNNNGISNTNIGIMISKSSNNTLRFNNGISNTSIGIYIDSDNNTLTSNIGISDTSYGSTISKSSNNNNTKNNLFQIQNKTTNTKTVIFSNENTQTVLLIFVLLLIIFLIVKKK